MTAGTMLAEDEVDNSAVTLTQSTAKRGYIPSGIAAAVVIASSAVVAALGILVTAGGRDQQFFHLPSVMYLREKAPNIDIVNMPTATGPLYHLLVAAVSGPLHLGAVGTQIVGSFFAAALAALAVWHTRTVPHAYGRVLAAAPLLLSPYFWESSLWMLTDDAAILFALAALITLMSGMTTRNQLTTGLLVAGAIATRQNFVWLLAPACATYLYELRFHPVSVRAAAIARVSAPGAITLAVLVSLWKGLTPTWGKGNAATQSLTSVSFAFAAAAIFAIPILLATLTKPHVRERIPVDVRGRIPVAVTVGMAAAMPAVIFTSSATTKPDDSRRGGVIWSAVSMFPDVANRSPLLAALAFVGGFASTILYFMLTRRIAILLATSLMSVAIVTSAGAQLYQKYVELPIGILTLIALVYLFQSGRIVRKWPLLSLALFQATMTAGIVGLPILRALQS